MGTDIEEKMRKIEHQKKKILVKERELKEKEKRKKFKRVSEIVGIAFNANLDQFEDVVLLGAFLEIAEKINKPEFAKEWKKKGDAYLSDKSNQASSLLAITFKDEPDKEVKKLLKEQKFRWNPFRKEFCGFGNPREMEDLLQEKQCTIQILP